jgi:hypothetical protein
MRRLLSALPVIDVVLAPFVLGGAMLLKFVRWIGVERMPVSKAILMRVGVFPIRNHYYEPLFDARALTRPLSEERSLPGIDWNVSGQLDLLLSFRSADELHALGQDAVEQTFRFGNVNFGAGDAEYLYNIIRLKKPARILEIGSGFSTLMAARAVRRNREEDPAYQCQHVCIEPYEMPWLESAGVTVVRERVEMADRAPFAELGPDDLLFIDSSHVIRPQGDVLFEYLELLPSLATGVIVHVHDIFSPRDYPADWVKDKVRLWNEQYLVEAFLSNNHDWKVIGALNLLHHRHFEQLAATCPFLTRDQEPGSLYLQKTS